MLVAALSLIVGCGVHPPADDPRRYIDSLAAVVADPSTTQEACGALRTPALQEDCILAGVERLTGTDIEAAAALCVGLPTGRGKDECGFLLAERTGEAGRCAQAGRFILDCRMHLLQRSVSRAQLPADPAQAEGAAAALLEATGFSADDEHAWTLLYRDTLSRQVALDLSRCDATPRAALCRRAGGGLFHDRLNFARDTTVLSETWCGDRVGLAVLDHVPDPDIDAILAQRTDICP